MPENPSWASDPEPRPTMTSSTTTGGSAKKSKKKVTGTGGTSAAVAQTKAQMDEVADRTAVIANRLKELYSKSVHPVEKRYQYDYFFESPFMTDVEFDGKIKEEEAITRACE